MFFAERGTPVIAPISGHVVTIGDVDEPIFAGRVIGDGVAIVPSDGHVVAPISGVVSFIGDMDLALMRERQFDLTCPVVITSAAMDKVKRLTLRAGQALAGQTVCMRYVPVKA